MSGSRRIRLDLPTQHRQISGLFRVLPGRPPRYAAPGPVRTERRSPPDEPGTDTPDLVQRRPLQTTCLESSPKPSGSMANNTREYWVEGSHRHVFFELVHQVVQLFGPASEAGFKGISTSPASRVFRPIPISTGVIDPTASSHFSQTVFCRAAGRSIRN